MGSEYRANDRYSIALQYLTRSDIFECFEGLSARLGARGVRAEIAIVGGAAMVLEYHARAATRDVRLGATLPFTRKLCEEQGPEPLRRRNIFAPPDFLTMA